MAYAFDHLDRICEVLNKSPLGLITDVDGTISRIAPTPQAARVSPLCRRYLSLLRDKLSLLAVISGRPAAQLKDMIGIDGIVYIGAHGMERWVRNHAELSPDARPYIPVIDSVIREVSPRLSVEGVSIENKGAAVTFHYRLASRSRVAEEEILNAVKASDTAKGLRVIRGKMAVELLAPVEINKGSATLGLIREYKLRGAIYLGDDATDIDAFKAVHNTSDTTGFQGFAIGVTGRERPEGLIEEADFTLKGVRDVGRFLKWLSQNVSQLNQPRP